MSQPQEIEFVQHCKGPIESIVFPMYRLSRLTSGEGFAQYWLNPFVFTFENKPKTQWQEALKEKGEAYFLMILMKVVASKYRTITGTVFCRLRFDRDAVHIFVSGSEADFNTKNKEVAATTKFGHLYYHDDKDKNHLSFAWEDGTYTFYRNAFEQELVLQAFEALSEQPTDGSFRIPVYTTQTVPSSKPNFDVFIGNTKQPVPFPLSSQVTVSVEAVTQRTPFEWWLEGLGELASLPSMKGEEGASSFTVEDDFIMTASGEMVSFGVSYRNPTERN